MSILLCAVDLLMFQTANALYPYRGAKAMKLSAY